jgi:hypothetical protein
MFPPKKKSPAIGVMIGLGPKGDDGSAPSMPPKYKSSGSSSGNGGGSPDMGGGGDTPMPPKPKPAAVAPPAMGNPAHEAAETPGQESGEEYGAKLIGDMTEPLLAAGMPPEHAKTTLASIFDAMAKCLRGEESSDAGSEADDSSMGMGGGGGQPGGY